ncbi:unnamed protein product [Peronospora belbahrii]|uniref:rRNA-processing protein EFG1 n=1 Tax=Peronospora belbahrii TaxID=622444 RepID=A0AAU9L592_9STRA|nr:unnamed protein product [Peronospora belbahrii]CAH0522199.1 unnamed protein product [Peronospora belbahrii]
MAPTAGTRLRYKNKQTRKSLQNKKIPSLKNRIRGLKRFLIRGGLGDATRRAKEAELKQLIQELENNNQIVLEKKNAEKYKKPRFFERVKVMRKLRQVKNRIEQAKHETERSQYEKEFKMYQEEMMYIYYYPKSESYIPLYASAPHSEENEKRQKKLRDAAISRFEEEQPMDAFHQFCFNDKSKDSSAAGKTRSAAELLLKNPTKEMVKRQKKAYSKRGATREKVKSMPVLVDQEEDDETMSDVAKQDSVEDKEHEEKEVDDFFL